MVIVIDQTVNEVLELLGRGGEDAYFGEAVTKLQHAEQCAWHATQAGADEELILAALLHDIGHLLENEAAVRDPRVGVINHDALGEQWLLSRGFSARLAGLVGAHVEAKRYLTAVNGRYRDQLSPASQETLRLQGGPLEPRDAEAFRQREGWQDRLRLRTWDELAKDPSWTGPGVEAYREMLARHLAKAVPPEPAAR